MKQPTVIVFGAAERLVDPDAFLMTARIAVQARDVGAAHAGLAQRYTALDRAVMALGADGIDIDRGAVHSYGETGSLRRWTAERSLSVRCRDTSRAAEVAGTFGRMPDVQVDGPHWLVDRANPAYGEMQARAVTDARERAERYALALGGELGRLVELRDTDLGGGHMMLAAARSLGPPGEPGLETMVLAPQPQLIRAQVETRWYVVLP
jgi:uncharacterized protein YggE